MKTAAQRIKGALVALAVIGSLSFGAAQAVSSHSSGSKCVNPDTGCPCKPGCQYGGQRIGCCLLP
ncbi:hypothetical protein J2Y70_001263 [Xanthomonas translucens]|nr:hypothetical protein [Xanthomonas translucens]